MGSYTLFIYIYKERGRGEYNIHPRERFCCITAASGFKVAKFEITDSNVKKTSFRDWPYNWPEVSSIDVKIYRPPTLRRTFRCKFTYIFLITKYFLGKIRFLTKKSWLKGPQMTRIDKNFSEKHRNLTEEYYHELHELNGFLLYYNYGTAVFMNRRKQQRITRI